MESISSTPHEIVEANHSTRNIFPKNEKSKKKKIYDESKALLLKKKNDTSVNSLNAFMVDLVLEKKYK
jgi:hypothetical protein